MGVFLNPDSKFFAFLSNLANLIILNLLWIVCCLPVVTIVPATSALYYVTSKIVKKEDPYIIRSFFYAFVQNLKQGMILTVIFAVLIGILYVDMQVLQSFLSGFHLVLLLAFYALCVLVAVTAAYVCPLLSRFHNTVGATLKNSLIIGLTHPIKTITVLALDVIPMIMFLQWPNYVIATIFLWVLIGFSAIALVNSVIFSKLFTKYEPEKIET